ncbi:phosphatase PAP2 family protein [Candidatus Saccharibacteria bacterium]|nr:phosphatase PAP2 family protein [Candidatus Saccharibacteria bacterium]MBR0372650.1 phosphatase PAP2 family protein [Candidatus Saccharibacteria bacterium]
MQWELITNIILISSFITLGIFVILGLIQWITRKSLKKVDKQLRWMPLPLVLMAFTYFLFDKVIILATRPNGSGEPSFPSTHVLVVTTIYFIVTIVLPKYVESRKIRLVLEILILILVSLTCTGRVLAGLHTPIDVIGGLIFAFAYSEIYYQIIKNRKKKEKKAKKENR